MSSDPVGFRLCNLLLPDDAEEFEIATPTGTWFFEREPNFASVKHDIEVVGKIGNTYAISTTVTWGGGSRSAAIDAALDELVPISLGASYLTGLAVAPTDGLPLSAITFLGAAGPHFPRQRATGAANPIISDVTDFRDRLETFVGNYAVNQVNEKALLLVHHWLDAIACWSLEDLVLSTSTMLEIIAATAERVSLAAGNPKLKYFVPRIDFAASRFGLPLLSSDFRDMRNDLVHEGHLSATKFANKDQSACTKATLDALNWLDEYLHHALVLGTPSFKRFDAHSFQALNAFSL